MRYLRSLLARIDRSTVVFLKKHLPPENWCANVHDGRLYLSKGSIVFMLGECQEVINAVFEEAPTNTQEGEI